MMIDPATLALARLVMVDIADEAEPGEPAFCVKCHIHVVTDPEFDPSPMCNPCAQDSCAVKEMFCREIEPRPGSTTQAARRMATPVVTTAC